MDTHGRQQPIPWNRPLEHHEYRRRAHLAEMVSLLGPPPLGLLSQGDLWSKFFSEGDESISPFIYFPIFSSISLTCASGEFHGGIEIPPRSYLEQLEIAFEDEEDKQIFCDDQEDVAVELAGPIHTQ